MPQLEIIRVAEIIPGFLKGGTTRPLTVVGDDGLQYVLKLFSQRDASQRSYTVAEAFAYILAKELDLQIPDAKLMIIPPEVLDHYQRHNTEIHDILLSKDLTKPSFGSQFHEGLPIYSPTLNDKHLEVNEFESIYAFDMLILNEDRRITKPNILRSDHYFIIDHEKAFEGTRHSKALFDQSLLPAYHKNHLFYKLLRHREKNSPDSVTFETFSEYFRSMNTRRISEVIQQCIELGYTETECKDWLNYILEIRKNSAKFVTLLRQSIK